MSVAEEGEEAGAKTEKADDRDVANTSIEEGEAAANKKADIAQKGFGRT